MAKDGTPGADAVPEEIQALGFEAALAELEDIVRQLEGGEVDLEQSIEMYTRGAMLKRHCEAKLKAASERVERIVTDAQGAATGVQPAEIE